MAHTLNFATSAGSKMEESMLSSLRADDKRIPDRAGRAERGSQECMAIHSSGMDCSCRFSGRKRLIRQIKMFEIAMFRWTGIDRKWKNIALFCIIKSN